MERTKKNPKMEKQVPEKRDNKSAACIGYWLRLKKKKKIISVSALKKIIIGRSLYVTTKNKCTI